MNYLKDADNTYISGDSTGVITLYMKVAKMAKKRQHPSTYRCTVCEMFIVNISYVYNEALLFLLLFYLLYLITVARQVFK